MVNSPCSVLVAPGELQWLTNSWPASRLPTMHVSTVRASDSAFHQGTVQVAWVRDLNRDRTTRLAGVLVQECWLEAMPYLVL